MIEKIYLDSDVILDYLIQRKPFDAAAVQIIDLLERKKARGYVSSLIIWNLYYLLNKHLGSVKARSVLIKFRKIVSILPVNEDIIDLALNSSIKDFEDSVQYFASQKGGVDILISRNLKDYPKNGLIIMTPLEYLQSHNKEMEED